MPYNFGLSHGGYAYMDIFKKVCGKFGETIWNKYICINKTNIYAFNL